MEILLNKQNTSQLKIVWRSLPLIFILLITACSNTTVHLYTRYLSPEQTLEITHKLAEQNIKIETNELAIPSSVKHSALVYSPLIKDRAKVEQLSQILTSLGFPISDTAPLVVENHWYAKQAIGVMLIPEGVNPQERSTVIDLANLYQGEQCDQQISIRLHADNRYEMTTDFPSDNFDEFKSGVWRITSYPYIELRTEDRMWWFYFQVSQKNDADVVGKIEKTILMPVERYRQLPYCNYTFGLR